MAAMEQPARQGGGKTIIMCFDGTGNKFQGNQSDSNIIKIFHLLDRQDPNQYHYYQPGIGTYVESGSLSRKSRLGRIKSWYIKSKDMAIGSSFGEHVMAGYKFLQRYYNDGDRIYMFGFSRGAYTARFLAQMLDYIGLLAAGNEEMLRFAWKTFARWQMRGEGNDKDKAKKHEMYEFMLGFRNTFSKPVCRIEFLGLFDCVNSVAQFESAVLQRTRFPYTAKTSAKVIRHAVSIDERRAKFRQDLLGEQRLIRPKHSHGHLGLHHHQRYQQENPQGQLPQDSEKRPPLKKSHHSAKAFRPHRHPPSHIKPEVIPSCSASQVSVNSATIHEERIREAKTRDDDDDDEAQDILELWFAGQHGDIGGGWTLSKGEDRPLSDIALMWMLREAKRAGMPFDEFKLESSNLFSMETESETNGVVPSNNAPVLQVDGHAMPSSPSTAINGSPSQAFANDVNRVATTSRVHDALSFSGGLSFTGVLSWQFMEWLPFRRMDLQEDGSWAPVVWPLPRGETRDMAQTCMIHNSVIKRMEADPNYRPGNLIVGGGGRGKRRAPERYGMGTWEVAREPGDVLGEAYVKVIADAPSNLPGKAS